MKYFAIILFILISCGKSTEKQTLENFDLEKLDVLITKRLTSSFKVFY